MSGDAGVSLCPGVGVVLMVERGGSCPVRLPAMTSETALE